MPCPSAEALAALFDCVLSKEQASELRQHVSMCPRCAADVRILGQLLDCPDPEAGPAPDLIARSLALADHPAKAPAAGQGAAREDPEGIPRRVKLLRSRD